MIRRDGRGAGPALWVMPGLGLLGGIVLGGTAMARPDLHVHGSLSLAEAMDDNLFYTSESRQRDAVTRLTPGFEAGSRWERLTLSGAYSLDAERFADHSELDTNRAREFAAFDLHARLTRPVSFTLHGDYLSTLTPGELNVATGVAAGRARARRFSAGPSLGFKLGPGTDGTLAWTGTRDDLAGGIATDTRTSSLAIVHRHSLRTSTSVDYGFSRYRFEAVDPIAVHTLTLGWERRVGTGGSILLRAGPRYSDGGFDPEASVALQHAAGRFDASLDFGRTLSTVIGQTGTFVTDSALAGVAYRPIPSVRLSATPGVYRIRDSSGGPGTRAYVVGLEGSWRIGDRLSLVGRYRRNMQRGLLNPAVSGTGEPAPEIARDVFFLGLSAGRSGTPPPVDAGGRGGVNR